MRFAHQLFLVVDQFFNVIAAGYADETLSARAFRSARRDGGKGRWELSRRVIDWLFTPQDWWIKWRGEWTGARHCERAFNAELDRKHYPVEYRS